MELLDNVTGTMGQNTDVGYSQYPRRKELLDFIHNEDETASKAYFSKEKETGKNKCQFIVPIAEVTGQIKEEKLLLVLNKLWQKCLIQLIIWNRNIKGFGPWNSWKLEVKDSLEIILPSQPSQYKVTDYYEYLPKIVAGSGSK